MTSNTIILDEANLCLYASPDIKRALDSCQMWSIAGDADEPAYLLSVYPLASAPDYLSNAIDRAGEPC